MQYKEIIAVLQNLTGIKAKQREIAEILGVRVSVIGQRASRGSDFSVEEVKKIGSCYKVDLFNKCRINEIKEPDAAKIAEAFENSRILNVLFPLLLSLSEDNQKTVSILAERLKTVQDKAV